MDNKEESDISSDAPRTADPELESGVPIIVDHECIESCNSPTDRSNNGETGALAIVTSVQTRAFFGKDERSPVTISEATAACRQSFEECLPMGNLMDKEWAENRLADFNLWAAGVGASAKQKASLEERLAFEPDVRAVVLNLLIMLRKFVEQCREFGTFV
jgi:hypothetical protein